MATTSPNTKAVEEEALLDHAERLARHREGRRAIHIHLSRLEPYNRLPHHLRIVTSIFDPLIKSYGGALFQLFNADMVVICKDATVAKIDESVLKLRFLFSDDPLLAGHEGEGAEFCSWYDIEQDYPAFLAMAQTLLKDRAAHDAELQQRDAQGTTANAKQPTMPLDPSNLATMIKAVEQADLSAMMRRQAICLLRDGQPPKPVLREIFVSTQDLRAGLMPEYDITANRWLFHYLTRYLDRRVLAMLLKNDDATLRQNISINLNVQTLVTPEFMEFDKALSDTVRRTLVLELQHFDVMAYFDRFGVAREFLRGRGYRLGLEGVSHTTLPYVDREKMGFDFVKLQWSEGMATHNKGARLEALKEAIAQQSVERIIMNRCDSAPAIEFGRSLGISMFQGTHVDSLRNAGAPRRAATK